MMRENRSARENCLEVLDSWKASLENSLEDGDGMDIVVIVEDGTEDVWALHREDFLRQLDRKESDLWIAMPDDEFRRIIREKVSTAPEEGSFWVVLADWDGGGQCEAVQFTHPTEEEMVSSSVSAEMVAAMAHAMDLMRSRGEEVIGKLSKVQPTLRELFNRTESQLESTQELLNLVRSCLEDGDVARVRHFVKLFENGLSKMRIRKTTENLLLEALGNK
jgi:hypothetical protein